MSKDVFVYYWNHVLDREFQIPEDVIHFKDVLKLKTDPWNEGMCYVNSLWKKTGIKPNFKKKYAGFKGNSELDLCVGVAIQKQFFNNISNGNIGKWLAHFKGKVEPVPLVIFHAWNLYKGKVADFTWGSHSEDWEYLGFIVPEVEVAKMENSPCVRKYLDKVFGLSQDTHYYYREGRQPKHREKVVI